MRDGIQRLTDDELRVVAAGAPDILEQLEALVRSEYHYEKGQIEELLSRIT